MGNLWKFSKDPISRRGHHRWFRKIRIPYLKYVNYLQPGLYRDKYRNLAVKNFQIWSLTLDSIQSSTNGHTNQYTPTAIWKLNLLKVITVTSEKPYYNYLRHCCIDFEQINTCWENATYFFITPIKQALVVHWILYSTQPIAHNLSY